MVKFSFSAQSIDDSDRAKVLEEFWQRKKEAASNKARGNQEYVSNAFQQVCSLIQNYEIHFIFTLKIIILKRHYAY